MRSDARGARGVPGVGRVAFVLALFLLGSGCSAPSRLRPGEGSEEISVRADASVEAATTERVVEEVRSGAGGGDLSRRGPATVDGEPVSYHGSHLFGSGWFGGVAVVDGRGYEGRTLVVENGYLGGFFGNGPSGSEVQFAVVTAACRDALERDPSDPCPRELGSAGYSSYSSYDGSAMPTLSDNGLEVGVPVALATELGFDPMRPEIVKVWPKRGLSDQQKRCVREIAARAPAGVTVHDDFKVSTDGPGCPRSRAFPWLIVGAVVGTLALIGAGIGGVVLWRRRKLRS